MAQRAVFAEQSLRVALLLGGVLFIGGLGITNAGPYLAAYAATALVAALFFVAPVLMKPSATCQERLRPVPAHFHASWSNGIGGHLPVFVSGLFLSAEALGYFALALQLSGPIIYGLVAARALIGARFAECVKTRQAQRARKIYFNSIVLSLGIAVVIAASINFALQLLLSVDQRLVLADFTDERLLVLLVALASAYRICRAALGPVQLVLVLLGDENAVRFSALLSVAVLVLGLTLGGFFEQSELQMSAVVLYGLTLFVCLGTRVLNIQWNGVKAGKVA